MGPTSLDQMHNYQQMLYRQQNGGMPGGDLRQKALQNQNRHFGQYVDPVRPSHYLWC